MLFGILSLIGTALLTGAIVYLTVKLTISCLKSYKRKKQSKLLAGTVRDLIKQNPSISLDDLSGDDVILAEYDMEDDELVQDIGIAKDVDQKVENILRSRKGVVVFE